MTCSHDTETSKAPQKRTTMTIKDSGFKVYEIELTTTLYKSHKYLKLQKFLRCMMANGENSNFEKVDEVKRVEKM
jgi:hypothetical protein